MAARGRTMLIAAALAVGCAFVGLLAGATLGGRYAEGFRFAGLRGYEAVGFVAMIAGALLGATLGATVGRRRERR